MRELTPDDLAMARAVAQSIGFDPDLESAAMTGLWEAATVWDGTGTWAHFARQRCRWRVKDFLRKSRSIPVEVVPDVPTEGPELPDHVDEALDSLEDQDLAYRFRHGDIDLRKTEDRAAIAAIRQHIGLAA